MTGFALGVLFTLSVEFLTIIYITFNGGKRK